MENSNSKAVAICKDTKSHQPIPTEMDPFSRRIFLREMIKNMPSSIQNRLTHLKNLQVEYQKMQVEYYNDIFNLEKKYHEKFQILYNQREKIVSGEFEPPEEEPKWKSDGEEFESELSTAEFSEYIKDIQNMPNDIKGVPDFWVNIFRNSDTLSQMVYDHDLPALKALRDIRMLYTDESSYTLKFIFNENPYFENEALTKQYFLKNTIDEEYPFCFEGLEIYKCIGCDIKWKDKMNLNLKTVRKREKHKETGVVRTTLKQVARDTFFKFFNPPKIELDKAENIDEDVQEILRIDFEIGHFLREEAIPKAVLYYTGDLIDDEADGESFDESDVESLGDGDLGENDLDIMRLEEGINQSIHN